MMLKKTITRSFIFLFGALIFQHNSAQPFYPAGQAERFYSGLPDSAVRLIEQSLPGEATVSVLRPKKLLVFNLHRVNDMYGKGHRSIPYANYMLMRMGQVTGAYETFFSSDTLVFRREFLDQFDAICFNNTAGVLFDDKELRNNLLEYVYSGKGFIGIHAAGATFCQWPVYDQFPGYGEMLGGYENGGHPWGPEEQIVLKPEEPDHPINKAFNGQRFTTSDEVFQFSEPYTRDRLRILLSIDTDRTDMSESRRILPERRADKDIAISWIRNYGRGRVFYTSLGHNPQINWNPVILQHYLDGLQFALGDLPAPATPSNRLTPAVLTQEKAGWRLGLTAYTFKDNTLFETIDTAVTLGLSYMNGLNFQQVSKEIPRNFDYHLSDEELILIRNKFLDAGITLVTYYIHDIPADEEVCEKLFEFGRKMGIETFIAEPDPKALDMIEKYCVKYNIKLAIHNHREDISPVYWNPENILDLCKGRSSLIGACGDFGYWARTGILPLDAVKLLQDRLIAVQVHDLNDLSPEGHDVAWGEGICQIEEVIKYLFDSGIKPSLYELEYSQDWAKERPEIQKSIDYFNRISVQTINHL
jgi:type 1 glutamine amidotransferase/sugar phosphate isomerase/epimerase